MTATVNMKADASGRFAIWVGEDDAPFDDPQNHVSALRFHSDFWSPAITKYGPVSITLPARTLGTTTGPEGSESHSLFAHGLAGTPLVLGTVVLSGVTVPLAGTVPLGPLGMSGPSSFLDDFREVGLGRYIHLGSDATDVFITERYVLPKQYTIPSPTIAITTAPAVTLNDIYIYVTDVILDADVPLVRKKSDDVINFSPDRVQFANGYLDPEKYYFRTVEFGEEFVFPTGETIAMQALASGETTTGYWRYSVNGYTIEQIRGDNSVVKSAQTFAAPLQKVGL